MKLRTAMIGMFNRNANGVRAIKSSLPSARTPLASRLNENI